MPRPEDIPPYRPSRSLIAAVGFFVLSLIAAGLILIHTLSGGPTPPAFYQVPPAATSSTNELPPDGPATRFVEPSITPTEEASQQDLPGLTVGLAGLNADPDLAGRLRQAIEQSLATSETAVIVDVELPPDFDVGAYHDRLEHDLLVVWESREDGLISIFILAPSSPPILQLEEAPAFWSIHAPGGFPVYADSATDLAVPAELIASTLDLLNGDGDQALSRLTALQARPAAHIEAIQVNNEAVIQFMLGQVYANQDQPVEALKAYSQAVRLQNDFAAAYIGRGNVYLTLGDESTAFSNYASVLAADPDQVLARYNRAVAAWLSGELDIALQDARHITTLYPDAAWSLNLRGNIYYQLGNYQEALADFARAHGIDPDLSVPLFNQALTLYRMEDYETALSLIAFALEREENDPVLHYWQGAAYQALGDSAQAEPAYDQAIRLNPDYVDAYLGRASLYLEAGAYVQALADAEEVVSIDPEQGYAYQIIGTALLMQNSFEEAEDAYTTAIELGQEGVEVYAGRGWARQRQGINVTAVRDYEQALALDPDDALLAYRMGFALYDTYRFEEALEAFEKAIAGGIDSPEAQIALAVALDANLKREEAEETLQRALEAEPRYENLSLLADQPPWSDNAIQRARTILERIEDESEEE
jgi:tetratricopeptide (TPR) repeat protein